MPVKHLSGVSSFMYIYFHKISSLLSANEKIYNYNTVKFEVISSRFLS